MDDSPHDLPQAPAAVHPALIGTAMPAAPLLDASGASTTLAAAVSGSPTVLIFYRGGW
jgi:hypothetical protein